MPAKVSLYSSRYFVRHGERRMRAPDGKVFKFELCHDYMASMRCILATASEEEVGHFDFSISQAWIIVRYGAFYTSKIESFSDWSSTCLKDVAIEVEGPWREKYRGIGTSMVSLALQWGRDQRVFDGMKIIKPNTPDFWNKLHFVWEGEDLAFRFTNSNTARTGITLRNKK